MRFRTSIDGFLRSYRGADSPAIIVSAIGSYREAGASNALLEPRKSCVIAALGASLYVCGDPSPLSVGRIRELAKTLKSPAVISRQPLELPGYIPRPLAELKFTGSAEPASPSADIIEPIRVIHEVFSVPTDRLLVEYLRRTSAGVSALYALSDGGETVAAAAADYIAGGDCVIGSVSVRSRARGNRFGFSLAASVAAGYRRAYVLCEPDLVEQYIQSGFTKTADLTLNAKE